ncbi:MAG: TetR/AcrR family transcriptional regulator [Solirubrobacterales bacterium]
MASAPDTRTRLIDSAMHRFAAEGVLAATLDQVRGDAGASVGAVYHHFPDKEALVDGAGTGPGGFRDAFAAELERHRDAEDGIKAMVRFLVRWCFGNRDEATLLLEGRLSCASVELNREFFDRVQRWWTIHAHYGTVRGISTSRSSIRSWPGRRWS